MHLHNSQKYKVLDSDIFLGGTRIDICFTCGYCKKHDYDCYHYNRKNKELDVCSEYIPKIEYYP